MSHAPLKPIHQSLTFTTWSSLLCKSITSGKLSPRTWRKTWFCRAKETERERERESYLGRKNTQVGTSWHKPTQARLASLYQSSAPLASAHDVRTSFTMFYMSSCLDMFGILWLYCSDLQVKYAKLPMLATKIPRSVQSFVLDRMAKPELPGREVL